MARNELFLKIEIAENNLERVINWIKHSDNKITVINVFQTGLTAFLINKISDITKIITLKTFGWPQFALYFSIILFIFFLINSVYKTFKSLYPDTESEETSMFYFGSIAKQEKNKFIKDLRELNDEEILSQLNSQVYINSRIAFNKFKNVKQAINNLYISIVFWVFSILLITIII